MFSYLTSTTESCAQIGAALGMFKLMLIASEKKRLVRKLRGASLLCVEARKYRRWLKDNPTPMSVESHLISARAAGMSLIKDANQGMVALGDRLLHEAMKVERDLFKIRACETCGSTSLHTTCVGIYCVDCGTQQSVPTMIHS